MDVVKLINNAAKELPDKTAFYFADKAVSFSELRELVLRLAKGLKEQGVNKGSKVAICLLNSPEYLLSYLAIYALGAIAVPLDFMFTQEELERLIIHCEAKLLITRPKKEVDLAGLKKNSRLEQIILPEDFQRLIEKSSPLEPQEEIADSDYSTIFYTSGSTGHPKGVLLNYRHLDGPVKAIEHFISLSERDAILGVVPFSHAAGWVFMLLMLYFKAALVIQERFQPFESLREIEKHKVSLICLVPAMYIALLSLKEFEKFDLKSLRYAIVFGAPSSPELLKKFHQACPDAYLLNGWGMTETSPPNAVLTPGSDNIASVGKLVPWMELKIVDDEDKQVPPGEPGELAVRGWTIMEGYFKEPEMTQEVFRNGWFYTGDLARQDKEGFLYIVGRKKEMLKVAGQILYVSEVEEVLLRHAAVAEAAVIGIPDKMRGELPKAFIVPKAGNPPQEDELRYFCRQHLANFKIPHAFEIVKGLPRTRSGKIDKKALREVSQKTVD